ncbi:RNA polymerase subunit beta [Capnocytophaga canimorsus Cc5]|uniref:DNA-directed RNA polymerase subunit beta n=2 Tax=Capnocytophaga canimorsus TaxID=28188 RepID=F9YS01_CAPCC|nr:RNA polymerase subunit beta [Capnocytophaga canimorsus Cc5]
MTSSGTFVINGAERVIVSQLHRSPGVFFGQSFHANGTKLYSARIIPFKGSWIEFATDINNVMYAYIDRKKKLPVTTLFRAIGFERDKDILEIFDLAEEIKVSKTGLKKYLGRRLAARVLNTWHEDFVDEDTGEVVSIERNEIILDRDTILDKDNIEEIVEADVKTILLHKEDNHAVDYTIIHNTLQKDPTNSEKEAVEHIYRQLRNAEPPDEETARGIIDKLFFSDQRYNLGDVGRYRMNKKLGLDIPEDKQVLTKEDIITIVKYLIELINSKAEIDDIDHLSNRRVRTVGEQLSAQFGVGLSRMARTIRERMNVRDNEVFTPIDLINAKTLSSVINSFFGTNQLSQFMDQTNPLAEITHKRRLSALGPGGLSRERAGFEVRDVHYTHYGRLCPIETPEGPNIGLISSLAVFSKVNGMGFIETPYRRVVDGKVDLTDMTYLSAEEEEGKMIGMANINMDDNGVILDEKVVVKEEGDFPVIDPNQVDFIDVAPNQIASISASLIPFLEHDDANRALMGSNMMRQAVPLLKPESPIVGTGLERRVASDSRVLMNAEGEGTVDYVDADKIIITYDRTDDQRLVSFEEDAKTYDLIKFRKTNQGTCINLKPIVRKGDRVTKGQVLCEGYATQQGELALGRNMKVAFMPWKGYNFEDAIVISERVVREDIFTSIHIDEYSMDVRDTKLGAEELTNDIPNVSEDATKDLDENGMIRIGAEVRPGDILIGKITPKGESDPTPEEKLLRAIFGDKAGDVKDASLKASPSLHGVVIDKKLFSRAIKDKRKRGKDKEEIATLEASYSAKFQVLKDKLVDKLFTLVNGKTAQGVVNDLGEEIIPKGKKYTQKMLHAIEDYAHLVSGGWTSDDRANALIDDLLHNYKIKLNDLQGALRRDKFTISVGDELPAGVMKLAKIYIAKKRKLKVGDKMAGRHGNKGIVARIVRDEDMPFLEDGTPVDIVLNPLGVPSRMNIGQIYETVLGWAGQKLGQKYATPIFDGASLEQINELTDKAGVPRFGHTYLYDGGTGERFDQPATVGVIYMIKLGHMIDDKMHARSIGPYSLITQQPLGGKAQFGGQRFGEMEVWALEAYGASSTLREILTVKSDDVIGRAKTYEAIVKGEPMPEPGLPESFNVLMHELKGLGLDIRLEE